MLSKKDVFIIKVRCREVIAKFKILRSFLPSNILLPYYYREYQADICMGSNTLLDDQSRSFFIISFAPILFIND